MPNGFIGMVNKLFKYFIALYIQKKSAFISTHENERIYQARTVRYRSNIEGNGYKMRITANTVALKGGCVEGAKR
jgi:hypothetical protein